MGPNSKEVHLKILICTVDELEMRGGRGWLDLARLKLFCPQLRQDLKYERVGVEFR